MTDVPALSARAGTRGCTRGVTLIEVIIATTIMAVMMMIVASSFTQVVLAQRTADRHQKALHHGEFVMELLSEAMRSTAYLGQSTEKFGFRLEDSDDEDIFSWVTSSSAFIHPGSPLKHGLHRLQVSIHEDEECLAVLAYPYLIDDSEENELFEPEDAWVVSRKVKGVNCRPYFPNEKEFKDEWENERSIPQFVEITLFIEIEPKEEDDRPEIVELQRVIEIPVGYYAREQSRLAGDDSDNAQAEQDAIQSQQQQELQQRNQGAPAVPVGGAGGGSGGTRSGGGR